MLQGLEIGLKLPDLWQQQAVRALKECSDVVVDAPTGAGKTWVFELYFKDGGFCGGSGRQAVFTVPTRALANDKWREWKREGWNVGIATGDVAIKVPSIPLDDTFYIYKEGADLRRYYFAEILDTAREDSLAKRRVFKAFNAEKAYGEWNEVELIVLGDSSIHVVNGKVVMRLFNSSTMKENKPLTSGKLILQSEGAEVYYKDIFIKNISEIPPAYK